MFPMLPYFRRESAVEGDLQKEAAVDPVSTVNGVTLLLDLTLLSEGG